jgi:hypothetical protein
MFYVLASHNIYALKRQFETLPIEETTVIINTLDLDFLKMAVMYCNGINVRLFITASDGTAATGKNSFLDQFDKDGIPHAVLVDGDDYLTARGVKYYKKLANHSSPPDAIVLENCVVKSWASEVSHEYLTGPERPHIDPTNVPFKMSILATVTDWELLKSGALIENIEGKTKEDDDNLVKYIDILRYGMGINEIAARVVFMSRKALKIRYNNEFIVGEDTVQYLELKDLHHKGEIKMFSHDEGYPTYIYDVRLSGIAVTHSGKGHGLGFLNWMKILLNKLQELKDSGKLHNTGIEAWSRV